MKRFPFLLLLLSAVCFSARAQTAVYAEYSAADLNIPNTGWHYGPTVGIYYDPWGVPFVRAGIDARASFIESGSISEDTGLIGPRIQLHPHVFPLMPYVEGLVGVSHVDAGQGSAQVTGNKLAYALNAGTDLTIFPRIDWRVIDYTWGGIQDTGWHPSTLSTGLVLRLP